MTETYKPCCGRQRSPAGLGGGRCWLAARRTDLNEAVMRCQYLTEDGRALGDIPQNVWRLPTVEEAVRSMSRRGVNSGGTWNEQTRTATYRVRPDKESPLWNVRSQVIYWWTATEVDSERAYIVVYDGKVWQRRKAFAPATLGYRCVKPV